ncbi:DNA replication complex GINS protein PSF2 [Ictalurus punctatus]|uniref:DNA replication complex GINS protein PSF2 n=1 Tax=Ictalurus punctatus TaxID=7998 RepID=W5U6T0_ICTPU|nr:DNA replication complex GINS protein PSF2 [Ictalurus punctatus]XP_053478494.1 DNA replication complex GINS protein PSF2 isoform X1 [Ictalurus furcatus]
MDPSEVEFLAEKEMVKIIPNFSLDKIYLIGGDLGPFNPGLMVEVPVWLALNLKQRQKCRIVPPEWMDADKLEEIREQERREEAFTPIPSPYYMELTKLLLNHAADNIPRADEIRTLVKDIWDTRIAKLRLSADSFISQQEAHARLDNLTLMEINTTRTFLLDSLNYMYKLRSNLQPGSGPGKSQDY